MAEIDLTRLPRPNALEDIGFEALFERRKQRLLELCPDDIRGRIAETLALESEPLTIDLQQQAYHEMLLRHRINEAAAAGFLALATGADLDHHAAARGLSRKLIRAADPEANPPVEAVWESDKDLRRRVQLHPEKFAAAGPAAAYVAHALDAHSDVADAKAVRPQAGTVRVYIKTHSNQGRATAEVIDAVQEYLSAETRRPLCDTVEVQAARAKNIAIRYQVAFENGPDKTLVQQQQNSDLAAMLAENQHIGAQIALSKIIGALDTVGVKKIILQSPTADIECNESEFVHITQITAQEADQ